MHDGPSRTLADLALGERARILDLRVEGAMGRRLLDLGFVPGSPVEVVLESPLGDPRAYGICETLIALRREDARLILCGGASSAPSGIERESEILPSDEHLADRQGDDAEVPSHGLVALAGNPNTGKSTVFNALTGLRQHVGNWPGKTVARAQGRFRHGERSYELVDLPGTYSLQASSPEEEIARDFLLVGRPACTVVVTDATALRRNLNLALQIMEVTTRVLLCVNLVDEAEERGLQVDAAILEQELGIPVVLTAARSGRGLDELVERIHAVATGAVRPRPLRLPDVGDPDAEERTKAAFRVAHAVTDRAVTTVDGCPRSPLRDRLDGLLTSRLWGGMAMVLVLAGLFWITIVGANIPSRILAGLLMEKGGLAPWCHAQLGVELPRALSVSLYELLHRVLQALAAPSWLSGLLVDGVYLAVAWVVSVMLPPMAIFFPLFTFLEDLGFLPRVAFNLDRLFRAAGGHGKQALTMAMGFGCNAAGVVACRIIDSPRERLIAMLTNTFVPCNGRWPTLILMASILGASALSAVTGSLLAASALVATTLLGVAVTLLVSWGLSKSLLRGLASSFTLELPPYRKPLLGRIIVTSLVDRTWFVLRRAVICAAPAGGLIWLLGAISVGDGTLFTWLAGAFDAVGRSLGLDGVILVAFLFALPANEIVIPTVIMGYLGAGRMTELADPATLFAAHGWTGLTALCLMLFSLLHYPCSTVSLTIRAETGSWKWTLLANLLPLALAMATCFVVAQGARAFGWG